MFGMTEKEFWEDDPQLYWSYQIFYLRNKKLEIEQHNNNAWLEGIYTLYALQQAMSGLSKKGKNAKIYPEKPINFDDKEKKVKSKKDKEEIYVQDFNKWARI